MLLLLLLGATPALDNYYFQDWPYPAVTLAVLVSQWRSTSPPLATTASCRHCRPGETTTVWRGWWSAVEEITVTPGHLASL